MMALWCISDSFARGKHSRLEAIPSNSKQVSLNNVNLSAVDILLHLKCLARFNKITFSNPLSDYLHCSCGIVYFSSSDLTFWHLGYDLYTVTDIVVLYRVPSHSQGAVKTPLGSPTGFCGGYLTAGLVRLASAILHTCTLFLLKHYLPFTCLEPLRCSS
jgi:hypothetical protein